MVEYSPRPSARKSATAWGLGIGAGAALGAAFFKEVGAHALLAAPLYIVVGAGVGVLANKTKPVRVRIARTKGEAGETGSAEARNGLREDGSP